MGQDDNFCASRNKRLQTGQNPPDPLIVTDPAILQWHIHIKTQQNAFVGKIHFIGKQKPVSHKTAPSLNMPIFKHAPFLKIIYRGFGASVASRSEITH